MAKTFGDLILEYQNYEYSKENYELTKEAYEIDLMNQYIESYEFASEEAPEYCTESAVFTEGYFIESNESSMDALYEAYNQKSEGFVGKIINGIKRLIEKIVAFFKRLFNKDENDHKDRQGIMDMVKKYGIPALVGGTAFAAGIATYKYGKTVAKSAKDTADKVGQKVSDTVANTTKVLDNPVVDANPEDITAAIDFYEKNLLKRGVVICNNNNMKMAASSLFGSGKKGLSNEYVTKLYAALTEDDIWVDINTSKIIFANGPEAAFKEIVGNEKRNATESMMKIKYAKGGTMKISFSTEFKQVIAKLDKLAKSIANEDSNSIKERLASENPNAKKKELDKVAYSVNEAYRNFTSAAGVSMDVYASVVRYRADVVKKLKSISSKMYDVKNNKPENASEYEAPSNYKSIDDILSGK